MHNDDDHKPDQKDNVINFVPSEKIKCEKKKRKSKKPMQPQHPPMLNIPETTKRLAGIILGIHLLLFLANLTIAPQTSQIANSLGGFISGSWTGTAPWFWWTPLTPITSMFLHGSWMHVGVNLLMMVAIGSGVEKWLGSKRYLLIFMGSGIVALLTHLAFDTFSDVPVVGASGAISGLFGAIILGMRSGNTLAAPLGSSMMPVILLYIGISILMGIMGSPDGSNVAWIAHIGGFLGGIAITHQLLKS